MKLKLWVSRPKSAAALLAVLVCALIAPQMALADNQFWIMGKRDSVPHPGYSATYAGLSFYTTVFNWLTLPYPSWGTAGMHVSSGYMWKDSVTYIETGAKADGYYRSMYNDPDRVNLFVIYENWPETTGQHVQYSSVTVHGWDPRFRIESLKQGPGPSSWDVYVDGTRRMAGKNMYQMFSGSAQLLAERQNPGDSNAAVFYGVRSKWWSDKNWHDWASVYLIDNDPLWNAVADGPAAWHTY